MAPGQTDKAELAVPVGPVKSVESASISVPGPAVSGRKQEHPLRHAWTLFFDSKSFKPPSEMVTPKEGETFLGDYEKSLVTVGKFDTVGLSDTMANQSSRSGTRFR
jgi:hypothetical protein